ncbi:MAG: LysR family transcriptional regulator [Proteobacteria bacterium]|nr:LysR family transcriptional regulator [Pseudomonadota bacterium]
MRPSADMPPLHALRAFEAAGRLLSFRRAAEELSISQSAVSHHVANVERFLGTRLFVRKARSVELAPAAGRFLAQVQKGFAALAAATAGIRRMQTRERLKVSLLPSFAANFLVRRLPDFIAKEPLVDIALDPTLDLADVAASAADLAIRYGDGAYPDVAKRLLATERLFVVASPALLAAKRRIVEPEDVRRFPLLTGLRLADWTAWSAAKDIDLGDGDFRQLTDYNIVLQAAQDGQGLAIGRQLLVDAHLRSGRLVKVFPDAVESPRVGYWLVTARHRRYSKAMTAFADWLKSEMAACGADDPVKAGLRARTGAKGRPVRARKR